MTQCVTAIITRRVIEVNRCIRLSSPELKPHYKLMRVERALAAEGGHTV